MQFKPKSEKELKEQMLWPAGEYDFEITKAEPAKSGPQSKSPGTPYIKLIVRIFNREGVERLVNAVLHPSMEWQLRSFCYEVGLEDKYEAGTLEAQDCENVSGKLQLKIEDAKGDFPAKNAVKDWGAKADKKFKAEKAAEPTGSIEGDGPTEDDSVPF